MGRNWVQRQNAGEPVVTLGRVAKALGCSRATVYTMARAGELPVTWNGGRYEMLLADLDRLIELHTTTGSNDAGELAILAHS